MTTGPGPESVNILTRSLVRHAHAIAREVSARVVLLSGDVIEEEEHLADLIEVVGFRVLLVTRRKCVKVPEGWGEYCQVVRVPDVVRLFTSSWALPCVPLAGPLMGMYVVPPPVGAGVWVEFEQGNPDKPIWVGCFWDGPASRPGKQGVLASTLGAGRQVVTSETGTSGISVSDTPLPIGTVSLYSGLAVSVEIGTSTITLTAPSVSIITQNFSINGAQFTVI